jgi:hypothetical protein
LGDYLLLRRWVRGIFQALDSTGRAASGFMGNGQKVCGEMMAKVELRK